LRHFVVDGASVNTAAISGMNMFSELAASIEVEVKEFDAVTTAHIVNIVKTLTETRPVMHVLCLGHFVKNRIADATKEFEKKPFAAAAEAMAQSLFTADGGTSTRRGDLSRYVTAFNTADRGKALSSLRDLLDSVNSIISLDPGASYNARQRVSALLSANGAELLPQGVTKERLMSQDSAEWTSAWQAVLKHLQRIDNDYGHGSPAANVATVNQTRWHTSAYASFVFMLKNLVPIRDFFKTQNNPKAKAVVDALADLPTVTADLEGYVKSLAAAATFL
jgi:hypothetical protein